MIGTQRAVGIALGVVSLRYQFLKHIHIEARVFGRRAEVRNKLRQPCRVTFANERRYSWREGGNGQFFCLSLGQEVLRCVGIAISEKHGSKQAWRRKSKGPTLCAGVVHLCFRQIPDAPPGE